MEKTKNLKTKAAQSVFYLTIKRILLQVIFTLSNIFLARLLFPADFGTFAIVGFVGGLVAVFTDLGLGPSLIQKKGKVGESELQTVFTFQFFLSLLIFLVINLIAPFISGFYGLGDKGTLLFRIYSIYFLLGPFKTTSGAILERNLEYRKLVTVELTEILFASCATVVMAFLGFGVFSFVIGGILGHFVGAAFYFKLSPWHIKFRLIWHKLLDLAKFGVHVQINSVLGLLYSPLILLYLSKKVGAENLGFYQFAGSISVLPLAFSEIISRIVFPFGSRVQKQEIYFQKIIERSITIVSATTLPLAFIGIVAAPSVVHYIYTDRWLNSLPAIYLGLIQMVFISYSGVFSQLLLSRGQSKIIRDMSIIWAILTWILAPILINKFNFIGMSLTSLTVSLTGLFLFFKLKKQISFSFLPNFLPFFISSLAASSIAYILFQILPGTFTNFVILSSIALISYLAFIILLARKFLNDGLRFLILFFYSSK